MRLKKKIFLAFLFNYFPPCAKELMLPFSFNSGLGQNPKVSAQSQTKVVSLKTAPGEIGSRLDRRSQGGAHALGLVSKCEKLYAS